MDPQDKAKLDKALALSEENNRILKSLQRYMRLGRLMSLLYWVVIIGVSVGSFYYLQPYINQILKTYSSFQNLGSYFPKQ